MIAGKSVQEKEDELAALEGKFETLFKEMEEKALQKRNQTIDAMRKKGERDSRRLISRAKTEVRKTLLANKSKAVGAFDAYLRAELKKFIESDAYRTYLENTFQEALKTFPTKEKLRVILRKEDMGLLGPIDMAVESSEALMGGFYLIEEDRIKYDYSMDGALLEISGYVGSLINTLIEDESGENDESA